MRDIVKQWMIEGQHYSPSYRGGLSNHLSMTLIALERLASTEMNMKNYFSNAIQKLEKPKETVVEITPDNFDHYLGKNNYFLAYKRFFDKEIANRDIATLLGYYSTKLSVAIGVAAFHPLIRLGYAIDLLPDEEKIAKHEIAISLAYLCDSYYSLGESEASAYLVKERVLSIQNDFTVDPYYVSEGFIMERMQSAVKHPLFEKLTGKIMVDDNTLSALANFSIRLYCETYDFSALHAVTATHALRLLLPYVESKEKLINHFWRAVMALYFSLGAPKFSVDTALAVNESHALDWQSIRKDAARSQDEHTIKFIYSCYCEFNHYNNPYYLKAAALKTGRYSLVVYHPPVISALSSQSLASSDKEVLSRVNYSGCH